MTSGAGGVSTAFLPIFILMVFFSVAIVFAIKKGKNKKMEDASKILDDLLENEMKKK